MLSSSQSTLECLPVHFILSHANTDLFTMNNKRNRMVCSTIPACVSHTVVSNQLLILITFWWVTKETTISAAQAYDGL